MVDPFFRDILYPLHFSNAAPFSRGFFNPLFFVENICKNPFQIFDIFHNFFYNVFDEKFSFAKLFVYY